MRLIKIACFGLGVALLVAVVMHTDMAQVGAQVTQIGWGFAVVLAVYFAAFAVDSVSWMLVVSKVPVTGRWTFRFWCVRMAGEAFNSILPAAGMGGEPVKVALLKKHYGISYREATASIILARTLNMIALIVFLAIGLSMMFAAASLPVEAQITAAAGLAMLTLGTVLMVLIPRCRLTTAAGTWISRWSLARRIDKSITHIRDMEEQIAGFRRRCTGRFWWALGLGFVNWLLGTAEVYYALQFIGHPLTWFEAWIIEAVAQMVRTATFFIPASLGAQEGAFLIVCGAITGSPAAGVSVAVVKRVRELVWVVAGFAIAMAYSVLPEAGASEAE